MQQPPPINSGLRTTTLNRVTQLAHYHPRWQRRRTVQTSQCRWQGSLWAARRFAPGRSCRCSSRRPLSQLPCRSSGQKRSRAAQTRSPVGGKAKAKQRALWCIRLSVELARQQQTEATSSLPTCNSLGLHRCHRRLDRLCSHRLHVPTPSNTCKEFKMTLQRCVCLHCISKKTLQSLVQVRFKPKQHILQVLQVG